MYVEFWPVPEEDVSIVIEGARRSAVLLWPKCLMNMEMEKKK